MSPIERIRAVAETLCDIFRDNDRMRGLNDWDRLIGCIRFLEIAADELEGDVKEVTEDG